MPYQFEWHAPKAAANLRKHGVSFDEAVTAFGDPLSIRLPDPDHSIAEERFVLLGRSITRRLLVVAFVERPQRTRIAPDSQLDASTETMKKEKGKRPQEVADQDTMRPEYDFSTGVRGATAARYKEGTNVVVLDPSVMDVFPDAESVNEALRALAPILRRKRRA